MRKSYKRLNLVAIILIIIFTLYSFFYVSGKEIKGVSQITENSEVTIEKYYLSMEEIQEYALDKEQIDKLKNLILKSDFKRTLAEIVYFEGRERYTIKIKFKEEEDWLVIDCLANEYISVTNQFGDNFLKVKNPKWQETLEEIIGKEK